MITTTILSRKGGSGKTTLAQMLASAMLDREGKVHMFDGDTDQQLLDWQAKSDAADWNGVERAPWPDGLTISALPETLEELYAEVNRLEKEGVNLVIIDTRPGANVDTEDLAVIADMILIPSVPTQSDFVLAARTIEWVETIISTLEDDDPAPLFRAVMMNAPPKAVAIVTAKSDEEEARAREKVHPQDLEVFDFVKTLPMLPTPVRHSDTYRRMSLSGPLSVVRDTYKAAKNRFAAGHAENALQTCDELLQDIEELVEAANG